MITMTIAGNVGSEPEMRRAGDSDVCNFRVAAETPKKDTHWFDVAIWGRRGEALCEHIRKGDKITVTGAWSTRDHDGKTYYKIDAHDVALQGGKPPADRDDKRTDDRDRGDDRRRDDDRRPAARDDRRDERRDDRRPAPRRDAERDDNIPY